MTGLRILHVDDEPDIREVVELSLGLDPAFTVKSCASGGDAIETVADWRPDLILCDVMMPVMDGPATLARLRASPETARIPVVFMTARAQAREMEHFKSLGATGVIAKPFDPLTLASFVRRQLHTAGITALRDGFLKRLRADAMMLAACRRELADPSSSDAVSEQTRGFAHALAGSAGIFGFQQIGASAATLEKVIEGPPAGSPEAVERALDSLLALIVDEWQRALVPAGNA
jgi:CheY-like chemotaxis protein